MEDLISRQAAINRFCELLDTTDENPVTCIRQVLDDLPSANNKGYTKADYIMALHKEYGCSLARAEEAHQKALEYLRNTSMMKG